MKIGKICKIM